MRSIVGAVYRRRSVLLALGVLSIFSGTLISAFLPRGATRSLLAALPLIGVGLMLLALLSILLTAGHRRGSLPPRIVDSPVTGRWLAMNSPATTVPSHGVRAYGQAYAIDLVYEAEANTRPRFADGPGMRAPHDFPAFGQPVLAMVDGTVVAASDRQRDHRSRSSWAALIYMMAEGAVRELGGPGFIVGNHVTIRADDGSFALVAHLKRGTVRVRIGDRVQAGEQIAECGNSGNSSEPHVHAQLMDRASWWTAAGIPMAFATISVSAAGGGPATEVADALPGNGEHMLAELRPVPRSEPAWA